MSDLLNYMLISTSQKNRFTKYRKQVWRAVTYELTITLGAQNDASLLARKNNR